MKHISKAMTEQDFADMRERWDKFDWDAYERKQRYDNPMNPEMPTSLLTNAGYEPINAELESFIYTQISKQQGFAYQFKGNPGNGKTELSRAIYRTVLAVNDINNPVFATTTEIWERYKYLIKGNYEDTGDQIRAIKEAMDRTTCYFLDELGGEQNNFKLMGVNKSCSEFVTGLLMNLYDRLCNCTPFYCVITTNLSQEDLRQLYGERIFDRIIEKFQDVNFQGKSFRKLQKKLPLNTATFKIEKEERCINQR